MYTRVSIDDAVGDEAPIWCVHGLSVSSRYMVPTARLLAPYRRVYAPDLPGFGRSAKPRAVLDVPALADALVRRMDTFGVSEAVMLGNSMGCQIIADVALRYPERLAAAVFVGPTIDTAARSMVGQTLRLLRDIRHESLASLLTQASDYIRCGPRRTLITLRYALADPFEAKLPAQTAPTLIVRGARDPIAPRRWCEKVTRRLPNGQFLEIPGAPHAANYDAPEALAMAVLTFLGAQKPTALPMLEALQL
jgi:pimeloyl-ACP methyl ester carboxylesterase